MPRRTLTRFVVEGVMTFPLDMLRYDTCYPSSPEDVQMMGEKGKRQITLHHRILPGEVPAAAPTAGRWESFGWRVVNISQL